MFRSSLVVTAFFAVVLGCSGPKTSAEPKPSDPVASSVEPDKTGVAPDKAPAPPEADPSRETKAKALEELAKKSPTADPSNYQIPPTGKSDWKTTSVRGSDLAKKVGDAMRTLTGAYGKTLLYLTTPAGNGSVTSEVRILNNKLYRIEFPVIGKEPNSSELLANGSTKALRGTEGKIVDKRPLSSASADATATPKELAKNWPKAFPRLVFRGIVDGKDPWGPLLSELTSPKSGFTTEVSERVVTYQNRKIKSYRVLAKRTSAAAKKQGPCEIEMVFDGTRHLPVTIRVNTKIPGEGEYKVRWSTGWNFRQKFEPQTFKY